MPTLRGALRGASGNRRSWADALRKDAKEDPEPEDPQQEEKAVAEETQRLLKAIDEREVAARGAAHSSFLQIPVFFRPGSGPSQPDRGAEGSDDGSQSPRRDGGMRERWRAAAREKFLKKRSQHMWGSAVMKRLWELLQEHAEASEEPTLAMEAAGEAPQKDRISYEGYCKVREALRRAQFDADAGVAEVGGDDFGEPSLSACNFFTLRPEMDEKGRVPIYKIFSFIHRKATLFQTRIELELNDQEGFGFLRENDLEAFIYDLLLTVPCLSQMSQNFHPFYVCGAVRKFFFFLDTNQRGRVYIDDIMESHVLQELMDLQTQTPDSSECATNWFAPHWQTAVYELYMHLDADRNGMLSRDELYNYGRVGQEWSPGNQPTASFTERFIDRAFDVSQTYGGEMDYKRYMDFVLATENVGSTAALPFFWQVLDVRGTGQVTPVVVQSFFRAVHKRLEENNLGDVSTAEARKIWAKLVENVTVEVFDMVNPRVPLCITLDDMKRCKNRGTVISMLIDHRAFYRYDSREQQGGQQNAQQLHMQQLSQSLSDSELQGEG
eukprot:TRINITY_DN833_c4_g1_i1.p1 TRINITY_DN833_c4_g1~~TRINITY_DN833_c4_g1_i1.p1  ORF type:complete len:584 (+),score=250.17 TRINITY_DN833_c4_g1_i1:99-1754(+)